MTNQVNNDVIKPIEYDHEMDRFYIPVNSRYEIQTKGKGSSFRIANTYTQLRSIVVNDSLHPVLEDMAKATNAEMGQLQATNKASEIEINALKERVAELQADNNKLREAGQALVDRWNTPKWKEAEHTAKFIHALEKAISSTSPQSLAEHEIIKSQRDKLLSSLKLALIEMMALPRSLGLEITHTIDMELLIKEVEESK